MFGRFFINVLFWQQFAVSENAGVVDSLRESRNLAHSGLTSMVSASDVARRFYCVPLACICAGDRAISGWTTLQHSFNELMTTQDPQALLQNSLKRSKRAVLMFWGFHWVFHKKFSSR